ncbi:MAG: hypothetical protein LCI03_12195 [Actinobacteria bacterium]|jgi:hypothetical protein|nr:hypothetical protein [Actinomycetota bacterium]
MDDAAFHRIPGVQHVRVVLDLQGRPREIHVVTDTSKPVKQFVRDIEAVAAAYYDEPIDRRIISIVQLEDEAGPAAGAAGDQAGDDAAPAAPLVAPRPRLDSLVVLREGLDAHARVTLVVDDLVFEGSASGPAGSAHRPRLVAEATLAALAELLGIPAQVESAQVVEAGAREVALAVITLQVPRLGAHTSCGSAMLRGDAEDAVARAVLAAVNRRLSG